MIERVINTTTSMPEHTDDGDANLTDVNGAAGAMDEDGNLDDAPINDDQTPRIYGMTLSALPRTEHTDCTVLYAAAHGQSTKRKIFSGPVTAFMLATALIDIDSW